MNADFDPPSDSGRHAGIASKILTPIRSNGPSLLLRLAGMGCTFGLGIVLARALGPSEYGIFGLIIALSMVAMTVAQLGIPQVAVRELSVHSERNDWDGIASLVRRWIIAIAAASAVLAIAAAVATIVAPSRAWYIMQGALLTPILAIISVASAALRGLGKMIKGQVLDIVFRPAGTLLIILIVLASGVKLLAIEALWVTLAMAVLAAIAGLAWLKKAIGVPILAKRRGGAGWLAAAIPLGLVDILRQADGASGMLLLGWLSSAPELGIFRVALSCATVVAMPLAILHVVQAPTLAKLHHFQDRLAMQGLLHSTSAQLVVIFLIATVFAWFLGDWALALLFGDLYRDAWLPLFYLCLGQLVFGFFGMGPILLAMCGGERALIKIYAVAIVFSTLLAIPLVRTFEAAGAAMAQIISLGSIGILCAVYARRRLGLDITFLSMLRR